MQNSEKNWNSLNWNKTKGNISIKISKRLSSVVSMKLKILLKNTKIIVWGCSIGWMNRGPYFLLIKNIWMIWLERIKKSYLREKDKNKKELEIRMLNFKEKKDRSLKRKKDNLIDWEKKKEFNNRGSKLKDNKQLKGKKLLKGYNYKELMLKNNWIKRGRRKGHNCKDNKCSCNISINKKRGSVQIKEWWNNQNSVINKD